MANRAAVIVFVVLQVSTDLQSAASILQARPAHHLAGLHQRDAHEASRHEPHCGVARPYDQLAGQRRAWTVDAVSAGGDERMRKSKGLIQVGKLRELRRDLEIADFVVTIYHHHCAA